MNLNRSLVLACALIAGILSALIARVAPRDDDPSARPATSASAARSDAAPVVANECSAERTELASIRVRLAVCIAMGIRAPKADSPEFSEASTPDPSESPETRRNRELLNGDSEAVIVRRADGTIGVYKPDEWPANGAGLVIGRKLPGGGIGWYSRPVAGTERRVLFRGTSIELEPDGRLTVRGKPAPSWVVRMLGGEVDEPDAGQGAADSPPADTLATPP